MKVEVALDLVIFYDETDKSMTSNAGRHIIREMCHAVSTLIPCALYFDIFRSCTPVTHHLVYSRQTHLFISSYPHLILTFVPLLDTLSLTE